METRLQHTRGYATCSIATLYTDIYDRIVGDDRVVHRALLGVRKYTATLTLDRRLDIMVRCGFGIKITSYSITWTLHARCHRVDGPAVEYVDSNREWWLDDKLHRTDGPAIEYASELRLWYQYGKIHRADGPAFECLSVAKWYLHHQLHRDDGPAIEYANGQREWYQNDRRHRVDGPAVERTDGTCEWWQNDIRLPEPEQ